MIQQFDLIHDAQFYNMKKIKFPDGQPHFQLDKPYEFPFSEEINVLTRLSSGNDLLELNYFLDFVGWNGVEKVNLYISYLMGARMDRRINASELPLNIISGMINPTDKVSISSVMIFDPHSDVATSVLDASSLTNEWLVQAHIKKYGLNRDNIVLVSPDAGATKKTFEVGKALGLPVAQGFKERNPSTGELSGFWLKEYIPGKTPIIVDDICDGGGTFAGLATAMRAQGHIRDIDLVVSHGIFSKGLQIPGISRITTTDSFKEISMFTEGRSLESVNVNVVPLTFERFE